MLDHVGPIFAMQFLFWIHHSPFTTVHPRSKWRLASLPRLVLISEHLEAKKSWNSLDAPWTGAAMRSLCHLKEISHWSCDGLSWNKSQRKIPKSTTHVKEVTFLAALQSLRVTIGFILPASAARGFRHRGCKPKRYNGEGVDHHRSNLPAEAYFAYESQHSRWLAYLQMRKTLKMMGVFVSGSEDIQYPE